MQPVILVAVVELLLLPLAQAASCTLETSSDPNYDAILKLSGTEIDPVRPTDCELLPSIAGVTFNDPGVPEESATITMVQPAKVVGMNGETSVVTSGLRFVGSGTVNFGVDITIQDCVTAGNGGGIQVDSGGAFTFENAAVCRNNQAGGTGGAVNAFQATVTFGNTAEFTNNTSGGIGGAVFAHRATFTFGNTAEFTGSKVTDAVGGAVAIFESEMIFRSSATFTRNDVDDALMGRGAAAFVKSFGSSNSSMTVEGLLTLSENTCGGMTCDERSGEVFVSGYGSSFHYCTADPNTADIFFATAIGGAVYQGYGDSTGCAATTGIATN